MIRVGIIGMGFMGGVHFRNWHTLEDASVAAICDTDPAVGTARPGNLGGEDGALDLTGVSIYSDISEMLEAGALDAVSIALPTYLHKPVAMQCLEAGVHVLCEKPMALSPADCDEMIAAAEKAGRRLMVAHCIRFWPEYAWLKQAVVNNELGAVLAAEFQRLTYAPGWDSGSWFTDTAKSGGIALDLHIHDLDFAQYLFGRPARIRSEHARFKNGTVGHVRSTLDYDDTRVVSATAGWMMPESFGFEMSYRVIFEHGAAVFGPGGLKVYPAGKDPFAPDVGEGDGYSKEIAHFAALLSGRETNEVITAEEARMSVEMALEAVKA